MEMNSELRAALLEATAATIAAHAEELTSLDQAIGDGDHGANLQRGFQALLAQKDELAAMEMGDALQKAGMTLVTTVGGASGALYGSLLLGLAKASKAGKPFPEQLAEAVDAVKKRGKSDAGAKTMLDVLVPVLEKLRATADGPRDAAIAAVRAEADAGREATRDMLATRGRASFLGERSRGHYDPGASSARLLIHAVCDVLEGRA